MPRFHPLTSFCFNLVRLILITWPAHLIKNIYIIKKQEQLPCNEMEEILYFKHDEEIWDPQLQRLLWIHRLNPEEDKSKRPLSFGSLHSKKSYVQ